MSTERDSWTAERQQRTLPDELSHAVTAAPNAEIALYLHHPVEGWLPILDCQPDIEAGTIQIVLGDSKTGAYHGIYETPVSDTEEFLFAGYEETPVSSPVRPHDWPENTVRSTPSESNLNDLL